MARAAALEAAGGRRRSHGRSGSGDGDWEESWGRAGARGGNQGTKWRASFGLVLAGAKRGRWRQQNRYRWKGRGLCWAAFTFGL
jgi:hypothetical protein